MRVNQAEDPVGLGIDQPEVTKSSYTPDAQGDRQNPAEPPESDDEIDIEELPEDKGDHIQDAEEVQLPREEVQIPEDVPMGQPQMFNKTPQET